MEVNVRRRTSNLFDPCRRQVSGPVNAVRLEGRVDGIYKVIYVFMDYHFHLPHQTECANVYALNFNQYLVQEFQKLEGSDIICDFFMEWFARDQKTESVSRGDQIPNSKKRYRYIEQLTSFLSSITKYDPEDNRVDIPYQFSNIRLHYLDIRESLSEIYLDFSHIFNNFKFVSNATSPVNETIITHLISIKEQIESIIDLYQTIDRDLKSPIPESLSSFGNNIRKILYGYKNKNIQRILARIVRDRFEEYSRIPSAIDEVLKTIKKQRNITQKTSHNYVRGYGGCYYSDSKRIKLGTKYLDKLYKQLDKLEWSLLVISTGITDVYPLRRLLDKEYITNAVTYTGASHSINYIKTLTKYFNFKVTHVSKISTESNGEINDIIRDYNYRDDCLQKIFIVDEHQCVDLTSFPSNFT